MVLVQIYASILGMLGVFMFLLFFGLRRTHMHAHTVLCSIGFFVGLHLSSALSCLLTIAQICVLCLPGQCSAFCSSGFCILVFARCRRSLSYDDRTVVLFSINEISYASKKNKSLAPCAPAPNRSLNYRNSLGAPAPIPQSQ